MTEKESSSPVSGNHSRRLTYRLRRNLYMGVDSPKLPGAADSNESGKMVELTTERDAIKENLFRLRAEFENSRKRSTRDREEANRRAGEDVISDLLPVLDNFTRAIQAAEHATDAKAVAHGVEMISNQITAALQNRGLEPIDAVDKPFDPKFHEAVGVDVRDDIDENQVTAVLQNGFMLRGRLLRPAMVKVSKKG